MDRLRLKAFISELESSHPETLERDLLPILKVLGTPDDVSTEEMIEASGVGRLEILDSQLHGEDFTLDKLGSLDFRNCSLSRSNFTKSDLSGVTMYLCGGKAISLRHVTGEAFKMIECNFDSLNASSSSFQGIDITGASLKNCFFSACELARFSISNSDCSDVDFSKAILSDGIFSGGLLSGCTFRKSMLSDVVFDGVELTDIDFSDAQVSGCNFEGTDLRSCNFQKSNLSGSMFFKAEIERSNFDGAVLEGARFGENTGLDSAGIREFQTRGAIFPAKPRELELA